jgi:predicted nucleic acid-binding protein
MMAEKMIVLDANILVRAVLGVPVPNLLERYHQNVLYYTPSHCFSDARNHLPAILSRRSQVEPEHVLPALDALHAIVQSIDEPAYASFEAEAIPRLIDQDPDDWPLIALALTLDCPLWTEDRDFFGTGIATWRTRTVELYLSGEQGAWGTTRNNPTLQ